MFLFQVGLAVKTDRTKNQYVNITDVDSMACLVQPNACGTTGGTMTAWVRILDCPTNGTDGGIISSRGRSMTGITIYCEYYFLK